MEILITVVATIAITLLIKRHCRKNLERLAANTIVISEEDRAAYEAYRRNVMRFYCTDGTKL
ncbi:hypothetical protein, partial [Oleiphilus sp. HI0125]|uniref:hypothetical protein n=1 Tax=Oleiphilus sp. HI0125 TaxID=1822266 RepID=UPI001E486156